MSNDNGIIQEYGEDLRVICSEQTGGVPTLFKGIARVLVSNETQRFVEIVFYSINKHQIKQEAARIIDRSKQMKLL